MAYCNKCGAKLQDGVKFCNECGANVEAITSNNSAAQVQQVANVPANENLVVSIPVDRGPWKIFAIVGLIVGIVSLVFSVIPVFNFCGFAFGIEGLVFSILGKKSVKNGGKATAGLVLNIVAMALGLILYIACIACLAGCGASTDPGYYY